MQFVVVVNEGEWGVQSRSRGDYDRWNKELLTALNAEPGEENEGQVQFVDSTQVALELIGSTVPDSGAILVFSTRGMVDEAAEVQKFHPKLRVVVCTGLLDGLNYPALVIVDKGGIKSYEQLRQAILG